MSKPLDSLLTRQWFKLICGASYQYLPVIRNLALVYTLAGADCIDMAADPAVVNAAREGIKVALNLSSNFNPNANHAARNITNSQPPTPWVMVSINNVEDLHFRKAQFDAIACPPTCDRPCISACPTQAIQFSDRFQGVRDELCYGCGRCLPLCPVQIIHTREQSYDLEDIADMAIDAIEIHTQPWRVDEFRHLWQRLAPLIVNLKLVAVSFPDCDNLKEYLLALLDCMQPLPNQLIWQTDGRPMSGDIGNGTTRAALQLCQKVLGLQLPRGFVQLAGGTNASTVAKLRAANIEASGVAYGSYARKLVSEFLEAGGDRLESHPHLLQQAVNQASSLVAQIKPLKTSRKLSNTTA
ncbi:LdpA C-terminal domain-containing domain [Pseudanabaena sp. PCC 6802]|uniref:Light dependent period protein LdpA domain-containing protein n=1 Tax=Pseudanabaena sp. PCC 6802 TaxID=118173 RepID=UPI00034DC4B1|nr:LdpA C-terminal domain-containing domain [Pseudanabaena sp. PCC 6802]